MILHQPAKILLLIIMTVVLGRGITSGQTAVRSDIAEKGLLLWLEENTDVATVLNYWPGWKQVVDEPVRALGFNLYLLPVGADQLDSARRSLSGKPGFRYLGPDHIGSLRGKKPNDPEYKKQNFHQLVGSERAWSISTGGTSPSGHPIVVAIFDSGYELDHEDLSPNLWINPAEIPDDGIDNDNNGFIDDYQFFNPRQNNSNNTVHTHGHKVAGLVGAKGNNDTGVTGYNWDVSLMLQGVGPLINESDMIGALNFVLQWRKRFNETHGAEGAYIPVMNLSLGFDDKFPSDMPALCPLIKALYDEGVLLVAATRNEFLDISVAGDMPCACSEIPGFEMLCVTNTTVDDQLVSNAAYSSTLVHLGAPGYQSFGLALNDLGGYGTFSGTSAAAPMVTGAVALLASMPCPDLDEFIFTKPSMTASRLRAAILKGTVPIKDLKGRSTTGGRLDLWSIDGEGSVPAFSELCGSPEGPLEILQLRPNPTFESVTILLRSPGDADVTVQIYNIVGQLIEEKIFHQQSFQSKDITLPLMSYLPGVYQVVVREGKVTKTAKLVIAK